MMEKNKFIEQFEEDCQRRIQAALQNLYLVCLVKPCVEKEENLNPLLDTLLDFNKTGSSVQKVLASVLEDYKLPKPNQEQSKFLCNINGYLQSIRWAQGWLRLVDYEIVSDIVADKVCCIPEPEYSQIMMILNLRGSNRVIEIWIENNQIDMKNACELKADKTGVLVIHLVASFSTQPYLKPYLLQKQRYLNDYLNINPIRF